MYFTDVENIVTKALVEHILHSENGFEFVAAG